MFKQQETFQEKLDYLNWATMQFVQKVIEMVDDESLPGTQDECLFPQTYGLMRRVLSRNYNCDVAGFFSFSYPKCGEDIVMNKAMGINSALIALGIIQFPAWILWHQAICNLKEYIGIHFANRLKEKGLC